MTFYDVYKYCADKLSAVSECKDFEAKCLLEHFYAVSASDIYSRRECEETNFDALNMALNLRLKHTPLQYIIGKWEFMDYEFLLDENVLIPRPETELLVECLEDKIKADTENVVYDLCSGTGCVAVSTAKRCSVKVYAFEKYEGAYNILKKNIEYNGASDVEAVLHDIKNPPSHQIPKADFILSNPPYVKHDELVSLQPEVRKEPLSALDGGYDGLDFYRIIYKVWTPFLKHGGYIALEIGENQEENIKEIFENYLFIKTIKDFGGINRVVIFKKGY